MIFYPVGLIIKTRINLVQHLMNYPFKKVPRPTSRFDIADYLDSNELIAEYLNTVLAEGNDSDVITAIGLIAKSIGMTKSISTHTRHLMRFFVA